MVKTMSISCCYWLAEVPAKRSHYPCAKPPPPAVFRGTQLRKFQVKFRDMLTLEPEDCCASGLEKILGDSGKAFAHVVLPCSVFP